MTDGRKNSVCHKRSCKFFCTVKLGRRAPTPDIRVSIGENFRVFRLVKAAYIRFVLGAFLAEGEVRPFQVQAEKSGSDGISIVFALCGTVYVDRFK